MLAVPALPDGMQELWAVLPDAAAAGRQGQDSASPGRMHSPLQAVVLHVLPRGLILAQMMLTL